MLKTSSVIWSSQRHPMKESLATADPRKKIWMPIRWCRKDKKLIPSITHVFRKDQSLYVYMEVYDPGLDASQKPSVAATLSFYRGKTKSFESASGAAGFIPSEARPDAADRIPDAARAAGVGPLYVPDQSDR